MALEQTLPLQFIKKSPYTGSYKGMRFRFWKEDDELVLCIYPEPFAFDKTPEEEKEYFRYPFTQESYEEAYRKLNEVYNQKSWKKSFF